MNFPVATSTEPPIIDNDHAAERDWKNRLPKPAQEKLAAVRRARDDARTMLEAAMATVRDLRAPDGAYADAAREHDNLVRTNRYVPNRDMTPAVQKRVRGHAAIIDDAAQRMAKAKADIDAAVAVERERGEIWKRAARTVTHVERWLESGNRKLKEFTSDFALAEGQTPLAELEVARSLVAALAADRKRLEQASMSMAEVKQRVRTFVEGRAARVNARGLIGHNAHITISFGEEADPTALLAWLEPDKLMRALERDAAAHLEGRHCLSELEQARELKANADRLLAAERKEIALIELLAKQGTVVAFRVNTDARAMLGVE